MRQTIDSREEKDLGGLTHPAERSEEVKFYRLSRDFVDATGLTGLSLWAVNSSSDSEQNPHASWTIAGFGNCFEIYSRAADGKLVVEYHRKLAENLQEIVDRAELIREVQQTARKNGISQKVYGDTSFYVQLRTEAPIDDFNACAKILGGIERKVAEYLRKAADPQGGLMADGTPFSSQRYTNVYK